MAFDMPREVENFFTIVFLYIMLISYFMSIYHNDKLLADLSLNQVNLGLDSSNFTDLNLSIISLTSSNYLQNQFEYYTLEMSKDYLKNSTKSFYFMLFLYWIAMPLVCFYYAIFRFKSDMWNEPKDLNILTSNEMQRGDL